MYDFEPRSEAQAWDRRIDAEMARLNQEADQRHDRQQPQSEAEPECVTWEQVIDRAVAQLKAEERRSPP